MRSLFFALLLIGNAAAAQPGVTLLSDAELRSAIQAAPAEPGQTGLYVVRLSAASEAPVVGIRRTAAGRAETHAGFGDVWYVIEGAGTLVTGGTLVEGVETEPGELRGSGIAGGTSRRVRTGELVVVPAGVPHWISAVEGDGIVYIVVKTAAQR